MISPSRRPQDAVDGIEWLWEHTPPFLVEGLPIWHPKDAEQALRGLTRKSFEFAYRAYENRVNVVLAWYSRLSEPAFQAGLQPGVVAVRCSECGEVIRMAFRDFCHAVPIEHPLEAATQFAYRCPQCTTKSTDSTP
jgi:hypothetical protein